MTLTIQTMFPSHKLGVHVCVGTFVQMLPVAFVETFKLFKYQRPGSKVKESLSLHVFANPDFVITSVV